MPCMFYCVLHSVPGCISSFWWGFFLSPLHFKKEHVPLMLVIICGLCFQVQPLELSCAALEGCSLGCMACISGAALLTPKHRKHGVLPSCCFAVCSTPGNRGMLDSYEAGSVPRMLRERPLYHSLFWLIALIVSFLSSATNDGPRGSVGYRTLALGIACISDNGL